MATILIVDDNAKILQILGDALENAGHQVWRAPDGAVGLREFRRHRPQVVVTDLIMPNKEGLELIMALNQERPCPKIIAISGGGNLALESYLPFAKKLGADAILSKPFLPSVLLATINQVLSAGNTRENS